MNPNYDDLLRLPLKDLFIAALRLGIEPPASLEQHEMATLVFEKLNTATDISAEALNIQLVKTEIALNAAQTEAERNQLISEKAKLEEQLFELEHPAIAEELRRANGRLAPSNAGRDEMLDLYDNCGPGDGEPMYLMDGMWMDENGNIFER